MGMYKKVIKGRIINLLRKQPNRVVSGEWLCTQLGISRVAVWKHIQGLKEMGYTVDTTAKGYRLLESEDMLLPWEFPGRESRIHYFADIPSTMDVARDMARRGCPEFSVVIAGRQARGRGRLNRTWHSPPGGLYFTMVLRPQISPFLSARVNLGVAVVLVKLLRKQYHIHAEVKWPNDILIHNQKLCGILSEMEAEADRVAFINIGLGINVNNDPPLNEPGAVSMQQLLGEPVSRKKLLERFLSRSEAYLTNTGFANTVDEWKQYTVTLNRPVRIVTPRMTYRGTAVDVDENGALILAREGGTTQKVVYGDCFHEPLPHS